LSYFGFSSLRAFTPSSQPCACSVSDMPAASAVA
jgi:hypothetical protein